MLRSWAVALVLSLVGRYLTGLLEDAVSDGGRPGSVGMRIVVVYAPLAVVSLAAALAAARMHPEPYRSSPGQHLLAALAVPLGYQLWDIGAHWAGRGVEEIAAPAAAVAIGCMFAVYVDLAEPVQERGPGHWR
ncbi:hypothetical protein G5C51_40820 [Streptomyces sp. A7024]|uniref:Uncharacterized protein n=1 Tax=Streptomyces coryli TaxID=1128680 RepID=A0A6G4UDA8_9ACTN|nr:hypothetical protein [Streptomyces coryli]NGN70215.1 hypothetical protein [Streptomyces coryli]